MEQLLPYAERGLALLRGACRELLARAAADPDGTCQRLADVLALPEQRRYPPAPHAIVQVDGAGAVGRSAGARATIARGAALLPPSGAAAACRLRTACEVALVPVALSQARFAADAAPLAALRLPPGVDSCISLVIESAAAAPLERLALSPLRVFIDGEPAFCAALRDALFIRTACAYVEVAGTRHWSLLERAPVKPAGCAGTDAPAGVAAGGDAAGWTLAELLALPALFNFFDIDVAALAKYLPSGGRSLTLHLVLSGLPPGSAAARALARLSCQNLLLGCAPVVAEPVPRATPAAAPRGAGQGDVAAGADQRGVSDVYRIACSSAGEAQAQAFAAMLALYDMPQAALRSQLLAAVAGLAQRPARAWLRDRRGWSLVCGVEVQMVFDEHALAGVGVHAFADILAQVLGRHVHPDCFIQLLATSAHGGEVLLRCPPRIGGLDLAWAVGDGLDWPPVVAAAPAPTPPRRAPPAAAPW